MHPDTKIAGSKTKRDWLALSDELKHNNDIRLWQTAYKDYFLVRLRSKHLNPIKLLVNLPSYRRYSAIINNFDNPTKKELEPITSSLKGYQKYSGEGFTIATLQCVLIEFLASFRAGFSNHGFRLSYEHNQFYDEHLGKYKNQFQDNKDVFIEFLERENPFSIYFSSPSLQNNVNLAKYFYYNFRNYLIHGGDTNNNCKIRSKNNENKNIVIQLAGNETIFYRNAMNSAINNYLNRYKKEILNNAPNNLRYKFLLKMDDYCQTDNDL